MAWTLVTSGGAFFSSGSTNNLVLNTVGADLLILTVSQFNGKPQNTFTDSQGNTWQNAGAFLNSTPGFNASQTYYVFSPSTNASHTFVSAQTGSFPSIGVMAFSGSAGSGTYDVISTNVVSASQATFDAGSITTSVSNDLVVSILGTANANNAGLAVSSGTIAVNVTYAGSTNDGVAMAWQTKATAGAIDPNWSQTNAATGFTGINVAFKPFVAVPPPASTVAAFDTYTRHWRVNITSVLQGASSSVFHGKGFQTATYEISGVTGSGGSAQWKGSNDGITFVPIGAAITSLPATGVLAGPDDGVFAYYQLVVTGGDGTTSFNAVVDFTSQNAS